MLYLQEVVPDTERTKKVFDFEPSAMNPLHGIGTKIYCVYKVDLRSDRTAFITFLKGMLILIAYATNL